MRQRWKTAVAWLFSRTQPEAKTRRRVERRLREAEASYRALVEQVPLVMYVDELNDSSSSIYVGPQIEPILGYSPDEWLADPTLFPKLLHPADRERVLAEHRRAYERAESFSTEYRLIAKDGRVVWFHDHVVVVRDAHGRPLHAQGFLVDVTERKEIEMERERLLEAERAARAELESTQRQLAAQNERLLEAERLTQLGSWEWEVPTNTATRSDALYDIWGLEPQDFDGNYETFLATVHPDDRDAVDAAFREGLESGTYEHDFRIVRPGGDERFVHARGRVVFDESGAPIRMIGTVQDITERKKIEAELRHLAAIVESSSEAIVGKTVDGMIVSWNAGAEALYGYSAEEMTGRSVSVLVPRERAEEVPTITRLIERGERMENFETVRVRKDGRRIEVSLTVFPVYGDRGEITGAATIGHDITERRELEEQHERLLAAERAQNERLRELDRMKDTFVATVSHELRTPLASISGFMRLLLDGKAGVLSEQQREFLAIAQHNTDRLHHLVNDLLFLTRVDAERLVLERQEVDLGALAEECVRGAEPLAETSAVDLAVTADPVPPISGDPHRLAQLVDNLVSNGLKFTPARGRVQVRVFSRDGHVVLEVEDSGYGIPAAEREHLFERFFRTSTASELAIQGTGLGLSIAKTIVEAHRGKITVESEEGTGSLFRVELPMRGSTPSSTPQRGGAAPAGPEAMIAP